MAASQSPSVIPESRSRAAIEEWIEAQGAILSEMLAGQILRITTEAYEAFIKTVDATAVTAAGDPSAVDQIIPKWNIIYQSVVQPFIERTFLSGSLFAYTNADSANPIPASVAQGWAAVVNTQAAEYSAQAGNRLRGVGETLWRDIRRKVTGAIESGASGEQLKAEIQSLGQFSEYRADTIGRTETSTAFSNGNWASDQALGEFGPAEKIWVAVGDARTRPSHFETMSTSTASPVPFNQPFSVGGVEMMFPHSPGAPAGEVVNCRCYYDALYPGDARPDGSIVGQPTSVQAVQSLPAQEEDVSPELLALRGQRRVELPYPTDREEWVAEIATREQREAVASYTGLAHSKLNPSLRLGRPLSSGEQDLVRELDALFDATPASRFGSHITYRGQNLSWVDDSAPVEEVVQSVRDFYQKGTVMDFGGQYVSTTTDPEMALQFVGFKNPVIFEIESSHGLAIRQLSEVGSEMEVLLNRTAKYEVISVEKVETVGVKYQQENPIIITIREVLE